MAKAWLKLASRHCEPTGRANARPMTGSAKQSILPRNGRMDCFVAFAPGSDDLLRSLRPHMRPILHRWMRRAKTGAPRPEQFFAQRARAVGLLVTPAPGQLRNQH